MPTATLCAALACLVLLPIGWLFSRSSNWSNVNLADGAALGFERNRDVWTSPLGLGRMIVLLVVVLGFGPRLRPPRVPRWLGLPILAIFAGLCMRPARDREQYFRAYMGESRRPGFDAELRALRSAVDHWSTREDRIIVSPAGSYREPYMTAFFYALRNGFARDRVSPQELIELRKRGARLYLQVDQVMNESHPPPDARPLASGAWWHLSCVAKDGCEARH